MSVTHLLQLSQILASKNYLQLAELKVKEAIALDPNSAIAYNYLGFILAHSGKLAEAEAAVRSALRLKPDFAEAHNHLGVILGNQGKLAQAEASVRSALKLNPNDDQARRNLQVILKHRQDPTRKITFSTGSRSPKTKPWGLNCAQDYNNFSLALLREGKFAAAEVVAREAIRLSPTDAQVHNTLGAILFKRGKTAEAEAQMRQVIQLQPDCAQAFRNIGEMKTYSPGDPDILAMEKLLELPDISAAKSMHLCFALGKAYQDVKNYDRAFAYLYRGNQFKRGSINFDLATVREECDRTIKVFSRELFAHNSTVGLNSDMPIFILGMPRSGTTLVEQILASHPQVHGAGELPYLQQLSYALSRKLGQPFPEAIAKIAPGSWQGLGKNYVQALRKLAPGARYITDKMPDNFWRVGLIHLLLPQAKIIHCVRNPADTCLSCYQKLFTQGQEFSYDLQDLGHYYQVYYRLMQHWQAVLPGRILDVRYEDVVANQDRKAREIMAFCGIEWDDACLAFYQTDRPVMTASTAQVRQPIYTTSVERWRRYQGQLAPLLEALGPLAVG